MAAARVAWIPLCVLIAGLAVAQTTTPPPEPTPAPQITDDALAQSHVTVVLPRNADSPATLDDAEALVISLRKRPAEQQPHRIPAPPAGSADIPPPPAPWTTRHHCGFGYPYSYAIDPLAAERWAEMYRRYYREVRRQQALDQLRKEFAERGRRVLGAAAQATHDGVEELRTGEYRRAIVTLTRAAELNQGDPASRIHLTQARLAVGHYAEAAATLRRALELQPKLVYIPLELDQYYDRPEDFAEHIDALREHTSRLRLQERPVPAEHDFLLGFFEFQRGDYDAAHAAFSHARRAGADDDLTTAFLEITKPVARE